MDIHLQDLPFIACVVLGIFLPELYAKMHWSFRVLSLVRLITLVVACVLATIVDRLFYPHADPGTMFTRAFIFVAFCRIILLSSHQQSEKLAEERGK